MDIFKHALDFHNSNAGFNTEAFAFSVVVYKMVAKKMGVFIKEQFEGLKGAMQIQSVTLDGHTKKFEEVDKTLNNHETRIGVLETKPKP